jgi:hypothetical protein
MDHALETSTLHFPFDPIHSLQDLRCPFRPACLASSISPRASLAPGTAGKSARADFAVARNSTEESATAWETKGFWTMFRIDLIVNDKDRPNVINDDPVIQSDLSSKTDQDKPSESGNAKDF